MSDHNNNNTNHNITTTAVSSSVSSTLFTFAYGGESQSQFQSQSLLVPKLLQNSFTKNFAQQHLQQFKNNNNNDVEDYYIDDTHESYAHYVYSYSYYQPPALSTLISPWTQAAIIVLYTCTSLFAFVGNLLVITVQCCGKETANSLRKCLINLAVSDLIFGTLCVPSSYTNLLFGRWMLPHILCPVVQAVQLATVFVTSFTLTLIGVERFLATICSFSSTYRCIQNSTSILLLCIWIGAIGYACIPIPHTGVRHFITDNVTHYYECSSTLETVDGVGSSSPAEQRRFMLFNFVCTFVLPLLTQACAYSAITCRLISTSTDLVFGGESELKTITTTTTTASNNNNSITITAATNIANQRNTRKTVNMMLAIVLLYGICWTPVKVFQFLLDFDQIQFDNLAEMDTILSIQLACHWAAMASSCVNPIVYSFMSKSFQLDLQMLRTRLCMQSIHRTPSNHNYHHHHNHLLKKTSSICHHQTKWYKRTATNNVTTMETTPCSTSDAVTIV